MYSALANYPPTTAEMARQTARREKNRITKKIIFKPANCKHQPDVPYRPG